MARFYGAIDERAQGFKGSAITYIADVLGISIGSLFGSSLVTACTESGAGTSEGGKTGLSYLHRNRILRFYFLCANFCIHPPWATGCIPIIIGSLMAESTADINRLYYGDASLR